jgi:hypothetical protein
LAQINKIEKPLCFTENQWNVYQQEITETRNGKIFDVCFDCTVEYQSRMRKQGRCMFPLKRLDKITEYA